jgi:phthalate 4,5-cis-dihydrodiol dehydrogenase
MATTNDRILNFGIVGLGRAATSMLPSLVNHPQVKLIAAADLRAEALEKFRGEFDAEVYRDAEELFRNQNIDAVYIATPHQCHAEHVTMAATYGKHAIVEKPMALTLADCDNMIAAVDRAGIRLVVGHTHSFDPPILKIREIVRGGELGSFKMMHTWRFTNFLYRPRRPEELDTSLGGGILFNQVPHQIDMIRWIGGGQVRSVRSMAGVWDSARPTEGAHATFLEFVDGAAATLVYNAYDHFDSDELTGWIGEGGEPKRRDRQGEARRTLSEAKNSADEANLKAATGYGGRQQRRAAVGAVESERYHPHFGVTLVSCEHGDLRPQPNGVFIYDDHGKREIPVPLGRAVPDKGKVVDELYDAVVNDRPVRHNGRWGKATLEACLAIQQSARERREIVLSHQVPTGD